MTDLEGLPPAYRWSLYLLKISERFGQRPSVMEQEPQDTLGHLERERIVHDALKRYS